MFLEVHALAHLSVWAINEQDSDRADQRLMDPHVLIPVKLMAHLLNATTSIFKAKIRHKTKQTIGKRDQNFQLSKMEIRGGQYGFRVLL